MWSLLITGVEMKKIGILICCALMLSACATNPDNITAAYVSPMQYANYSCPQLREEATRVSARAAQVTGAQSSKATTDAVAMGVGLILFWPSLFFIKGDGTTAAEVSRLKGEMDAIEQASVKRKCGIQFMKEKPAQT
jgi:hypothetical protein